MIYNGKEITAKDIEGPADPDPIQNKINNVRTAIRNIKCPIEQKMERDNLEFYICTPGN